MIKLTKENYKEKIDKWAGGDSTDRDEPYVYHHSYILEDEIQKYAFDNGIIVRINEYTGFLKKVTFVTKLK